MNHQQAPSCRNARYVPIQPQCCLLAVAVGGEDDNLGVSSGDDHVVLVVGAADARLLDTPLDC
jgi:hypothetical protein